MRDEFEDIKWLNANRGYFSSIRPGAEIVLLNVGITTGAIFPPIAVDKFVDGIGDRNFNEYANRPRLLIDCSVRICYDRAQHDPEFNPNDERNQHKTIASIDLIPSKQTFRRGDHEITVMDYFVKELKASSRPSDVYP